MIGVMAHVAVRVMLANSNCSLSAATIFLGVSVASLRRISGEHDGAWLAKE